MCVLKYAIIVNYITIVVYCCYIHLLNYSYSLRMLLISQKLKDIQLFLKEEWFITMMMIEIQQ